MSRKFIGLVLATSMTITAIGAAPARAANNDDVAKFIGAAAALFIIGSAIENSRSKKKKAEVRTHTPQHKAIPQVQPRNKQHKKLYEATRRAKPPLPSNCLRKVSGAKTKYIMGQRCLNRNYTSARPLPNQCRMNVRGTNGKIRSAYSVRCLRNKGYEVDRIARR